MVRHEMDHLARSSRCLIVLSLVIVAWLLLPAMYSSAGRTVSPVLPWMGTNQYFTFKIHTEQKLPWVVVKDEYIKVVVISSANGVLTVNEVFYNENDRIPQILAYTITTRASLNSTAKSAWLWVDDAAIKSKVVRIDEESARLVQTTKTQWVLTYSNGLGNSSTYYYDRSTRLLGQASGRFVGSGSDATVLVTRIASGMGGQAVEQPRSSSYVAPASPPDRPNLMSTWWYPPWAYPSSGTEYYGYGVWTYEATGSANQNTGVEYTDSKAGAGPFFGGARAQVWAYEYGPSAWTFTVPTTGLYTIRTHHTINGAAYLAILCRPPWGCAFADGWVWMRHQVYYKSNGVPAGELKEENIYDAPTLPGYIYWWTNVHKDLQSNYQLTAGVQYFFCDWVHNKNIAAAVGLLAFAYSHVHGFQSQLSAVELWRIA